MEEVLKRGAHYPQKLEEFIDEQVEQWLGLNSKTTVRDKRKMLQHLVGHSDFPLQKEKTAQQFATQLSCIKQDAGELNKEHSQLKKAIGRNRTRTIQLENNLQFISSSSDDNPMLKEVNKKIEQLNQRKTAFEEKANAVKSLKRALKKQSEAQEEVEENSED